MSHECAQLAADSTRKHRRRSDNNAELRALFAAFDKDRNGYIDADELRTTMHDVGLELSDHDVEEMMSIAGVVIKDRIYYEEFVKVLMRKIGTVQRRVNNVTGDDNVSVQSLQSSGYTSDDVDTHDVQIAFSMFDKDGDGLITVQEVHDTLASLGVHIELEQVRTMVQKVDSDGDGAVNFKEFRQVTEKHLNNKFDSGSRRPSTLSDQQSTAAGIEMDLKETFRVFDKDKDGFLNASDLRDTMQQLGLSLSDDDILAMMRTIGVGPHGKISFSDFRKMFRVKDGSRQETGNEHKVKARTTDVCRVFSRRRLIGCFSAEEKKELRDVFSTFDKDGDGFVTVDEIEQVLNSMGAVPSIEHIRDVFQQVDLDGNGKIDFEEFLLLVKKYERPTSEEREIREMFNVIDHDRNGFIDVAELKTTFAGLGVPLTDTDVQLMLKGAKVKGDRIFYEDFVQLLMSNTGTGQKLLSTSKCPVSSTSSTTARITAEVAPVHEQQTTTVDAEKVNGEELTDLRIQFAQFDKDGDGFISSHEICQVMNSLGVVVGPDFVRQVLKRANFERDDRVDFSDFCKLMSQRRQWTESNEKRLKEQEMRQIFRVFDKNRDGYIDENELRQTMKDIGVTLSSADVDAMMTKASCKIKGRIYYEEFVRLMSAGDIGGGLLNLNTRICAPVEMDESTQELRVAFAMVDKDCDGRITPRELLALMRRLGFRSDDRIVKNMIGCFDSDGNGTLEFEEFRDMMKAMINGTTRWDKLKQLHNPPDAWKAFQVFDRNGDGYISKSELYHTMKDLGVRLSMDDLDEMMRAADINLDGRIDYSEFSKLMSGAFKTLATQVILHSDQTTTPFEAVFQQRLMSTDLQEAFESVDTDQDGVINIPELQQLMSSSLGVDVASTQAESMMCRLTNNESGTLTLNEFLTALHRAEDAKTTATPERTSPSPRCNSGGSSTRGRRRLDDKRTLFRLFDTNNDGFIDRSELQAAMSNLTGDTLTDADVDAMMKSADSNGDGRIDYEDFVQMMRTK